MSSSKAVKRLKLGMVQLLKFRTTYVPTDQPTHPLEIHVVFSQYAWLRSGLMAHVHRI